MTEQSPIVPWYKRHSFFLHKFLYFLTFFLFFVLVSYHLGMGVKYNFPTILTGSSLISLFLLGVIHVFTLITSKISTIRHKRDLKRIKEEFC
jgi:hypothetical protein